MPHGELEPDAMLQPLSMHARRQVAGVAFSCEELVMPPTPPNHGYRLILPAPPPPRQVPPVAQRAAALQEFRPSNVFQQSGAYRIGPWVFEQKRDLSAEQQAMLESAFAHLKESPEKDAVACDQNGIRFSFMHPYREKTTSLPRNKMAIEFLLADPRHLVGVLTVNVHGEITGISISDPQDKADGREWVDLKMPSKRAASPSAFEMQIRKKMPAQQGHEPAASKEKLLPLNTPFDAMVLTDAARQVLEGLGEKPTSAQFYQALKESTATRRTDLSAVCVMALECFDRECEKQEKSLKQVIANFAGFAKVAVACLETCAPGAKDGRSKSRMRDLLLNLCERSFATNPLYQYVEDGKKDPKSPLHELRHDKMNDMNESEKSHSFLISIYLAKNGKNSIADPLQPSALKEFSETVSEIRDKYPTNLRLVRFARILRRAACPLKMDADFHEAIKAWELARRCSQEGPVSDNMMKVYRTIACQLAEYAHVHGKSKEMLGWLAKYPWQNRRESKARVAARLPFKPVLEWMGTTEGASWGAIAAVAEGLYRQKLQKQDADRAARGA